MFIMGRLGEDELVRNLADYAHKVAIFRGQWDAAGHELDKRLLGERAPRIFISHSSEDNAWCEEFRIALQRANADPWLDTRNLGTGLLTEELRDRIRDHRVFVLALSPNSVASNYVHEEMAFATELYEEDPTRIVLPVMAIKCKVPTPWDRFIRIHGSLDGGLNPTRAAGLVVEKIAQLAY
jgi:hypothetical protein